MLMAGESVRKNSRFIRPQWQAQVHRVLSSPSCQPVWWRIYLSALHVHHTAIPPGPLCRQQIWHCSGTKPCRSPLQLHPAVAAGAKNKPRRSLRTAEAFLVSLVLVRLRSIFLNIVLKPEMPVMHAGLQGKKPWTRRTRCF